MGTSDRSIHDVLGIGNAIVDVLAEADDGVIEGLGLAKGTMTLIDEARLRAVESALQFPVSCSGGSAANTMVGLASLGSRAAYLGRVRDDTMGRAFAEDIESAGVAFGGRPAEHGPPTGRCIVLVTPDGERTMQTFLGAAAELEPEDIDPSAVRDSHVIYLEGYLWDPPPAKEALLLAARTAHEAGRKVALSLSDPFCVERHREEFLELLDEVDLLFANETEVVSLFRSGTFDEAARMAAEACEVAALTRGALGSTVLAYGRRVDVPAQTVERVVDTTGAGDLFAAGFLHGWVRGLDAAACGRIGGIAAAEIIAHYGARPKSDLAALVAGAGGGARA